MLLLAEALQIINQSRKSEKGCTIEYVQFDKKRGTSGVVKRLKGCKVTGANHNEWEHGTVTVFDENGDHPYNIHIRLIMKVNGKFVAS